MHATVLTLNNNGYHGAHGSAGSQGHHGIGYGADGGRGGRGEDGSRGGDAGTVVTYLSADSSSIQLKTVLGNRPGGSHCDSNYSMIMGDPSNELIMTAVGGDGGHGGRGGDGGGGATGYPGKDATQYSNGTNGGPGGDGGDGGRGGDGGDSGHGATIDVYVAEPDMDTLMLLRQRVSPTNAGTPGTGGNGGHGGSGGSGGRGGSSYSWSVSTTNRNSDGTTYTTSTTYTNPGGYSGPSGRNGAHGHSGSNGCYGSNGVFTIRLACDNGQTVNYSSPYDLELLFNWVVDTIGYQVIEPACQIHVMVTHTNVGGMPTPSYQFIRSYVADNNWVYTPEANRVPLKKWIVPGQSLQIDRPILSNIADINGPAYGEPHKYTGHLEHRALVDRVNQDFARVRNVTTPFTIEFPVQNSIFKGGTAILYGEEAPMVFSVWNKSALSVGKEGRSGPARVLATTLAVLPKTVGGSKNGEELVPGDIRLRDAHGFQFEDYMQGLQSQIPNLYAGDRQFFASTLEFTNIDMKPYTRVTVESSLHFGHVQNMMTARNIQIRPFEVQLAEGYTRSQYADVLIIVNNRTEYDEMVAWRHVTSQIRSRFCVWNVHLYSDLKLDHLRKDAHTLMQDFCCGTIIFLNNLCLRDEKVDQQCIEFARAHEIFLAARDHGINILVYGTENGRPLSKELIPAVNNPKLVYYKSKRKLVSGMKKRLVYGEGDAQAQPATLNADLCGCLLFNKTNYWCVLSAQNKTLSYYSSAKKQFPDGMIYLESCKVQANSDGTAFDLMTPAKLYQFVSPELKKYQGKHDRYGSRTNYTEGCAKWIAYLKKVGAGEPIVFGELNASSGSVKLNESSSSNLKVEEVGASSDSLKNSSTDINAIDGVSSAPQSPTLNESGDVITTNEQGKRVMLDGADVIELDGDAIVGEDKILAAQAAETQQVQQSPTLASSSSSSSPSSKAVKYVSAVDDLTYRGNLKKQGGAFNSFSKFYVVLDPAQKTISFYTSQGGECKASYFIGRYSVHTVEGGGKNEARFAILTPAVTITLAAENAEDRQKWMFALSTRILPTEVSSVFSEQNTKMKSGRLTSRLASTGTINFAAENESSLFASTHLEHNTVIRIPVEERFIFFKPKPQHLQKKAKRLHKTLQAQFPNQRNVIVYKFNTERDTRGFKIHNLGFMDVHRSLDATTPHIVLANVENDADRHNPEVVNSPVTIYNLIKTQPFLRKLVILDQELEERPPVTKNCHLADHTNTASLAMNAILSDIADEVHHFNKSNWKQGLNTKTITRRLTTLQTLSAHKFKCVAKMESHDPKERLESVIGDIFVELLFHIKEITKHSQSVWDILLPFRRSIYVGKAAKKLCSAAIVNILHFDDTVKSKGDRAKDVSAFKKALQLRLKEKKGFWKAIGGERELGGFYMKGNNLKEDRGRALKFYYNPKGLSSGHADTHIKIKEIMSFDDFAAHFEPDRPDLVVEGRYMFTDDSMRLDSIDNFQRELLCPPTSEEHFRTKITPNIYPI